MVNLISVAEVEVLNQIQKVVPILLNKAVLLNNQTPIPAAKSVIKLGILHWTVIIGWIIPFREDILPLNWQWWQLFFKQNNDARWYADSEQLITSPMTLLLCLCNQDIKGKIKWQWVMAQVCQFPTLVLLSYIYLTAPLSSWRSNYMFLKCLPICYMFINLAKITTVSSFFMLIGRHLRTNWEGGSFLLSPSAGIGLDLIPSTQMAPHQLPQPLTSGVFPNPLTISPSLLKNSLLNTSPCSSTTTLLA